MSNFSFTDALDLLNFVRECDRDTISKPPFSPVKILIEYMDKTFVKRADYQATCDGHQGLLKVICGLEDEINRLKKSVNALKECEEQREKLRDEVEDLRQALHNAERNEDAMAKKKANAIEQRDVAIHNHRVAEKELSLVKEELKKSEQLLRLFSCQPAKNVSDQTWRSSFWGTQLTPVVHPIVKNNWDSWGEAVCKVDLPPSPTEGAKTVEAPATPPRPDVEHYKPEVMCSAKQPEPQKAPAESSKEIDDMLLQHLCKIEIPTGRTEVEDLLTRYRHILAKKNEEIRRLRELINHLNSI